MITRTLSFCNIKMHKKAQLKKPSALLRSKILTDFLFLVTLFCLTTWLVHAAPPRYVER